jgi:hypothetical protein
MGKYTSEQIAEMSQDVELLKELRGALQSPYWNARKRLQEYQLKVRQYAWELALVVDYNIQYKTINKVNLANNEHYKNFKFYLDKLAKVEQEIKDMGKIPHI